MVQFVQSLTRAYNGHERFPSFFLFSNSVVSNTLEKYGRVRENTDKQSKQKQHSVLAAAVVQDWQ